MTLRRTSIFAAARSRSCSPPAPPLRSPVRVWPVYHGNAQRTGNDTSEPALLPAHQAWARHLDAAVYAQPLVFNGRVFTATAEQHGVRARRARRRRPVVAPPRHADDQRARAVRLRQRRPARHPVDAGDRHGAHTIFVVATIQDSFQHIHHQLVGLDTLTGAPKVSANADPGGACRTRSTSSSAPVSRSATVACTSATAATRATAARTTGGSCRSTRAGTARSRSTSRRPSGLGAIWATGGATIDTHGNVYVSTGNPDPDNSGNFGESVLKFDSTGRDAPHRARSRRSPAATTTSRRSRRRSCRTTCCSRSASSRPASSSTRPTMTQLQSLHMCNGVNAFGTDAFDGSHLFVPCAEPHPAGERRRRAPVDVARLGRPRRRRGRLADPRRRQPVDDRPGVGDALRARPRDRRGTQHDLRRSGRALRRSRRRALGLRARADAVGHHRVRGTGRRAARTRRTRAARQTNHNGYWVAGSDGNVFPFGSAPSCGSLVGVPLAQPIVGMAGRTTAGYWLVGKRRRDLLVRRRAASTARRAATTSTSRSSAWRRRGRGQRVLAGRVRRRHLLVRRRARSTARPARIHLNQPIVGMAPTPFGQGVLAGRVATAGSSPSATRGSAVRWAAATSTSRSSAWRARRRAAGTGSSRPTAGSSRSATRAFRGSTGNIAPRLPDRRHGGPGRAATASSRATAGCSRSACRSAVRPPGSRPRRRAVAIAHD